MRVETANGEPPNSLRMLPLEQSIALHERRTTDAVRLGEYLLRRTPSGDFRHLPVSMMTADALSRLGRAVQAISVLEDSTVPRTASSAEEGYRWMDARAQLAGLYRQVGREMEARAVEEHLLKLLAVADPDDPLLMELKSRVAERGSPSVAISPSKPNR